MYLRVLNMLLIQRTAKLLKQKAPLLGINAAKQSKSIVIALIKLV